MTRPYVRRVYQHAIAQHQLDVARGGTWAGMGLGKTVETLTTLASLDLVEPGPALVCAPLRVAQSTWPDEARKWDHLRGFEVVPVVGGLAERRARTSTPRTTSSSPGWSSTSAIVGHSARSWPTSRPG